MSARNDRFDRLMLWLVPAAIVVIGCSAGLLPHHAIIRLIEFVVAWLLLSVPIGVVAGHCVLSEGDVS
jgi:hypothetical protein